MNKLQKNRWFKVSQGMARHCFPGITEERRLKLIGVVNTFILGIIDEYPLGEIQDWDGQQGSVYVCDELTEFLDRHDYTHGDKKGMTRETRFANMVSCCVRAGFDLAIKQSAGVLGFTFGDIRKIFNGKIPQWCHLSDYPNIPDEHLVWL